MASENAIYKYEQVLISEKSDNLKRQLDLALEVSMLILNVIKSLIIKLIIHYNIYNLLILVTG